MGRKRRELLLEHTYLSTAYKLAILRIIDNEAEEALKAEDNSVDLFMVFRSVRDAIVKSSEVRYLRKKLRYIQELLELYKPLYLGGNLYAAYPASRIIDTREEIDSNIDKYIEDVFIRRKELTRKVDKWLREDT